MKLSSGGDSEEDTPVPIPNTEVKLFSVEWMGLRPVRLERCQALIWRFSSAGRALALQARGQRFDPVNLHHLCRPSSVGRATDL